MIQIDEHIFQRGGSTTNQTMSRPKCWTSMYDPWIRSHRGTSSNFCFTLVNKKQEKNRLIPNLSNTKTGANVVHIIKYLQFFFRVETKHHFTWMTHTTPPKFNIKPENGELEDGVPFWWVYSQVPAVHLPGCSHTLQTNQDITIYCSHRLEEFTSMAYMVQWVPNPSFCVALFMGGGWKWCFCLGRGCWVWIYTSTIKNR